MKLLSVAAIAIVLSLSASCKNAEGEDMKAANERLSAELNDAKSKLSNLEAELNAAKSAVASCQKEPAAPEAQEDSVCKSIEWGATEMSTFKVISAGRNDDYDCEYVLEALKPIEHHSFGYVTYDADNVKLRTSLEVLSNMAAGDRVKSTVDWTVDIAKIRTAPL